MPFENHGFRVFRANLRRLRLNTLSSIGIKLSNHHLHIWPASCRLGVTIAAKWSTLTVNDTWHNKFLRFFKSQKFLLGLKEHFISNQLSNKVIIWPSNKHFQNQVFQKIWNWFHVKFQFVRVNFWNYHSVDCKFPWFPHCVKGKIP